MVSHREPKPAANLSRDGQDNQGHAQEGDDDSRRQVAGIGDEIDLFQFRLEIFLQGVDGAFDYGVVGRFPI